MSMTKKAVLGCIGAVGLVPVGIGTLVALNWDTLSDNLDEALDTQAASTQATLFRLGEVMSITAELKDRYGTEPDVTYDTDTGDRVLRISFADYRLPENAAAAGHAREIAAFAVSKTTKLEQIDTVAVLFQISSKERAVDTTNASGSYNFTPDELMPNRRRAEAAEPDDPTPE